MGSTFICTLLLSMFLGVKSFDECSLPAQEEKVDFNMIPGRWYQILSMNDPSQRVLHCFSLRDFIAVNKDVYFTADDMHYQKDEAKVKHGYTRIHMFEEPTSFYHFDKKYISVADDEATRLFKLENIGNKDARKTNKEIDELYDGKFAYVTDYENYLIEFFCGQDNVRYVWAFSHNPTPFDKVTLAIQSKLGEIGKGWDQLHLVTSECSDVAKYEELPPF